MSFGRLRVSLRAPSVLNDRHLRPPLPFSVLQTWFFSAAEEASGCIEGGDPGNGIGRPFAIAVVSSDVPSGAGLERVSGMGDAVLGTSIDAVPVDLSFSSLPFPAPSLPSSSSVTALPSAHIHAQSLGKQTERKMWSISLARVQFNPKGLRP